MSQLETSDAPPQRNPRGPRRRRTGRAALACGGSMAAVALAVLTSAGAQAAGTQSFASRPDLQPAAVKFGKKETKSGEGDVFFAPKSSIGTELQLNGPTIMDGNGNLVWFKYVKGGAYNFHPQVLDGRPVLTWWQGTNFRGYGEGQNEIYDQDYHHVATVKAGNGQHADLHEFKITPQNTALLITYKVIKGDLRGVPGGVENDLIMDNGVQEVDIKTGKVLLDWHTKGVISPKESYGANPKDATLPYDYVHLNSVDIDSDGNLIASGRATHAYYRINRKTGKLIERIGGKKSDYKMGPGARTAFQHDVRRINSRQLSAFDNNAEAPVTPISKHETRGVILNVDEKKKTVKLARAIHHPGGAFQSASQGNMQSMHSGNEFFGWGGSVPYFTEVDTKGKTVLEGKYLADNVDSYRAFRATWEGTPTDAPSAVASPNGTQTNVAVSWNGATKVKSWRILTGATADTLTEAATVPFAGFETTTTVSSAQPVVRVEALDASGTVLGTSDPVPVAVPPAR